MIVYGWNSFKIDECKPSKIGMSAEYDQQFTIERRQKYFHLFWIPFFGIGKIWAIKKHGDDKLYEPTAELRNVLESLSIEHKTPWYTFSLFFLALGGGILFYFYSLADDYSRHRSYEASLVERKEQQTNSINNPSPGTFFKMDASGKEAFLKVLEAKGNSLVCLYSQKKSKQYSQHEILEAFITDSVTKSFDTVKISKSEMLQTINEKEDYGFKGYEVIKGAGSLVLKEIKLAPFPVFKTVGSGYQDGEFFAVIQNIGANGTFKEYIPQKSNMELSSPSFPAEVKNGESVLVKGTYIAAEPFLQGKLKIESPGNQEAVFDCFINGTYISLEQPRQ